MTDTNSILYKLGQQVRNELDLMATQVSLGSLDLSKSFLGLTDTPSTYASNTPNIKLNDDGTALEFVGNNFVVDGEFRGMMNNLLHHNPYLMINAGDEHDITNISEHTIIWRTSNNTIRYLRIEDEYGAGGNDYFIRIDGGEPTCDGGGDYDPETNSCFPNTENVVAASTFQGVYDSNLASVASGSYAYSAKIRILKTGLYATGWIDVHQMYTDLNTAGANIASNDSDIANLQNDVATLQAGGGGGSAATYTKATLPLNGSSADLALVTDGTISGDPTMAYFYQGKWFRTLDNSEITDQTIDIYLLAGQSNAHGHADVSDLANTLTLSNKDDIVLGDSIKFTADRTKTDINGVNQVTFQSGTFHEITYLAAATFRITYSGNEYVFNREATSPDWDFYKGVDETTQDGLFYTSWHDNTSNASSTQYYSSWATSLVAGNTRGDSGSSTIGGSTMFGPEIGFVERANAINLTDGQPIGVLKHAIGASSLTDGTHVVTHNAVNYICIQTHQSTDSTKAHYVSTMPEPGTVAGSAYWSTTSEAGESTWSSTAGQYNDKGLSDWDLTDTGDKRGDALRAFKLSIADGLTKLTNAGYSYRLAGMIWWQGESGGANSDLIAFIDHIRTWLDNNSYLSMPKAQFPFVITGTTDYWGSTYEANVADQDAYVGFVNTQDLAAPAWADRTLVHPGSNETYTADQNDIDNGYGGSIGDSVGGPDFNDDGVNDMFAIGRAYADQMELAKSGSTNAAWDPSSITTRLWLDMDDQSTFTSSSGHVTQIADKSGNNYTFSAANGSTITAINTERNGKNILRFDNNSDFTNATTIAFASSGVHKWFFVVKVTASDNHDCLIRYVRNTPTSQIMMFNFKLDLCV